MTPLPDPNSSVEILSKATIVKEAISAGDASSMISDGFVLIGITPKSNDPSFPFRYSLIWPHPAEDLPSMTRQRWLR